MKKSNKNDYIYIGVRTNYPMQKVITSPAPTSFKMCLKRM